MADSSRSPRFPRWVTLADALVLALVTVAFVIAQVGGIRATVAGIFVSVTSPWRLVLYAAVVAAIRHGAFRRPTLWERLRPLRARLVEPGPCAPLAGGGGRADAREIVLVTFLMLVLTGAMTYPQLRQMNAVRDLGDPVFSIWRLAWIAHQLLHDPLHLFDANIFYPTPFALAYGDSMLLPAFMAAPFIWLGVAPATIHSLFLLASFVLAGLCMYLFMRAVTGRPDAALIAAIAFAFYPFRFAQYNHFEQMFSFWVPLTLWSLHRTIASGRVRDGLLTGTALAGQFLSGMYVGIFLAAYLAPIWAVLAIRWRRVRTSVVPLLAGAALLAVVIAPVVVPHMDAGRTVGERPRSEVRSYSPMPQRYLVAPLTSAAYADVIGGGLHESEKDLFPGFIVILLALVALWPPLSLVRLAYLLGLLFAFDTSLGTHGVVYPFLYDWFLPFRALRVPARFAMLVGTSLTVLAALGAMRVAALVRTRWFAHVAAAVLCVLILFESRPVLSLRPIPDPHPVYQWFAKHEPGVVAELPPAGGPPGWKADCRYMYASTFYWPRLLTGYSGAFPPSYWSYSRAMATFPDEQSLRFLREQRVEHMIVHEDQYGTGPYQDVVNALARRADLREVSRAVGGGYEARIYRLAR